MARLSINCSPGTAGKVATFQYHRWLPYRTVTVLATLDAQQDIVLWNRWMTVRSGRSDVRCATPSGRNCVVADGDAVQA